MEESAKKLFREGNMLFKEGKRAKSIVKLKATLEIEPEWTEVRRLLAFVLIKQGKFDRAIAECQTAIAAEPNDAWTHCTLGSAYSNKRKWDFAVEHYRIAIDLDANCADAYIGLGLALAQIAKQKREAAIWEEARENFQKAILLGSQNAKPFAGAANAEWHLGNKRLRSKLQRQ